MRQLGQSGNGGRAGGRWRVILWMVVIVVCVFPWLSLRDHSHWDRVQWIPFGTAPIKARDVVANLLLYVPLGYWWMRLGGTPRAWRGVLVGFLLSVGTEIVQVYSHGRFPSATDVTCNTFGAWLGTGLAGRRASRATGDDPPGLPPSGETQPG
jgi:glycopeptide antibiotics resistance protein